MIIREGSKEWDIIVDIDPIIRKLNQEHRKSSNYTCDALLEIKPDDTYWCAKSLDYIDVPSDLVGLWKSDTSCIVDYMDAGPTLEDDISALVKVQKVPVITYTYERVDVDQIEVVTEVFQLVRANQDKSLKQVMTILKTELPELTSVQLIEAIDQLINEDLT